MSAAVDTLEAEGALSYQDASRVFKNERHTTFADLWHFGDAGHRILAEWMLSPVARLLKERKDRNLFDPSRVDAENGQ